MLLAFNLPKTKASAKAKKAKKKVVARKSTVKKAVKIPASDIVFKIISRRRNGVDTTTLKARTGFKDKKIRDIIYRLKKHAQVYM
ncbi:hypothetical protein ACFL7M_01020 [Thermodesulfobacteriota bacterium]